MSTRTFGRVVIALAGLSLVGVGCSGEKKEEKEGPKQVVTEPARAAAPAAPAGDAAAPAGNAAAPVVPPDADAGAVQPDGSVQLTIEAVGDQIMFNKKAFVVPAGKKVTLTLKNPATTDAMKHNWILVQKGAVDEVGIAGLQAGEAKEYVPDDKSKIIAFTKLAGPKSEVQVTFDAPAVGEYEFLCSFPGHYTIMRGVFIVRPA